MRAKMSNVTGNAKTRYRPNEILPVPMRRIAGKSPIGVAAPPRLHATIIRDMAVAKKRCVVPSLLTIVMNTGSMRNSAVRLFTTLDMKYITVANVNMSRR